MELSFGPQTCSTMEEAARREWLVTDGLGGFAMGTIAGLRTRRYHGLLTIATKPPIGRHLGLASLDPVLVLGDQRIRLATHEWRGGAIAPSGHTHLVAFAVRDGVPCWRWSVAGVVVEREVAMEHGRPGVAVLHRVVHAPGPVRIELEALCTWRDAHAERTGHTPPRFEVDASGFVFEDACRVDGGQFEPAGEWYRGTYLREEAARGLRAEEDLWFAGRFVAVVDAGETMETRAWAAGATTSMPSAGAVITAARTRTRRLADQACGERSGGTGDDVRLLAQAADQFIVAGPTVVAGYPWFGDWSRDTMTSYEGLFLCTNRADEGRLLLAAAAGSLSEGMLANTSDVGERPEFNTVDGTLWFLHALCRHVEHTGDADLMSAVGDEVRSVIDHHVAGTRYGIMVDPADGLLTQGVDGIALTWMDARIGTEVVTPRRGKPVEVNSLWISTLTRLAPLLDKIGRTADASRLANLAANARASFLQRFPMDGSAGLHDVVDGPFGVDHRIRPNQLLAASLPDGPYATADGAAMILDACAPLVTPLGMRSLGPDDREYLGRHRGDPASRDRAYHQGTVWPWLAGPYVDASVLAGRRGAAEALVDSLVAHLRDWGVGSISETADGDAPHTATGCPFQAWSVAEVLRSRRVLG